MVVGELAHEKDLVIIGGGPGGYHAAIRAAQMGKDVTLIEKEKLGGVCLNKGCIPSKVWTDAAKRLADTKNNEHFGIRSSETVFELKQLEAHKNNVMKQLREGVEALCKANKIEWVYGSAYFLTEGKIGVENEDRFDVYHFKDAIIATGSTPRELPESIPNHPRLINSWAITDLSEIPKELIVLGTDYIALEMAMAYEAFDSQVTIVLDEGKSDFTFDKTINKELMRILKKSRIKLLRGYSLEDIICTDTEITLHLQDSNGTKIIEGSHLFYSLGMNPRVSELGLERLGMKLTEAGFIEVDHTGRTSIKNIYAIGDVTEGLPLATKAIKQGKTAAETICQQKSENDMTFAPMIIHTRPPIASAGLTEQEALEQGYEIQTGEFSLSANGYAAITGKKDGLVKVVFDQKSDLLIGIHIIGDGAIELMAGGTLALEMGARDEDLTFPVAPHPSLNEALMEAAEAYKGKAIHLPPKKQKVML